MNDTLYRIFYTKLPDGIDDVLPKYDGCHLVTCLNPFYFIKVQPKDYCLYEEFDYICSDGIGPIKMNKWFGHPKSVRISFDMSGGKGNQGLAGRVFEDCVRTGYGLYILGSRQESVEKFVAVLRNTYKGINIAGYHDGYIRDNEDQVLNDVIRSGAKVAVIGMGAPLQERVCVMLKQKGFIGTIYTCGGFIHQTTKRAVYYPKWVDRFNLRAFYRILHEKGMIKRLFETYPRFVWQYSRFLYNMK